MSNIYNPSDDRDHHTELMLDTQQRTRERKKEEKGYQLND
jgi:hypothetical protein